MAVPFILTAVDFDVSRLSFWVVSFHATFWTFNSFYVARRGFFRYIFFPWPSGIRLSMPPRSWLSTAAKHLTLNFNRYGHRLYDGSNFRRHWPSSRWLYIDHRWLDVIGLFLFLHINPRLDDVRVPIVSGSRISCRDNIESTYTHRESSIVIFYEFFDITIQRPVCAFQSLTWWSAFYCVTENRHT